MKKGLSLVVIGAVVVIVLAVVGITSQYSVLTGETDMRGGGLSEEDGMSEEGIMITNGVKHLVPLEDIRGGGPPKDGIPSIDHPEFVSADEADSWLAEEELGLGLVFDGVTQFYPFQILVWHEIVNVEINGQPVLVTYCPLCLTGIAFERTINGQAVEFGTSGKLWNSNLVMYDRLTDSYWSQITGQAIVGELTGMRLKKIPLDTTTWGAWKQQHPDTQVLSRNTGSIRAYGTDPYGNYYTSPDVYFPVDHTDNRLRPKAEIYAMTVANQQKAYPKDEVKKVSVVNDEFAGKMLLVVHDPGLDVIRVFDRTLNGDVLEFELADGKILDTATGSQWNPQGEALSGVFAGQKLDQMVGEVSFWFAWVAVYPETMIFIAEEE